MNARNFALAAGVIYIVVGILGFIPGVVREPSLNAPEVQVTANYGYLFGLFPVNILHTLFHLAIGVWGVIAARRPHAARRYAQSIAIIYAVLTVFGLIPGLNTLFGLLPLHGHDVWLHGLTAIAAAYFGFRKTSEDYIDAGAVAK
ncbi:MAG TPA: DUF4383 domain-containing protein [Burkholderiales bacterium]|nr:DUF4383 domain-containing protein [Burkholderiales bacterium]